MLWGCLVGIYGTALADDAHFGLEPAWLKILHMKSTGSHEWSSDVVSDDFFLSRNGKTDPKAEWAATIAAFESIDYRDKDSNPRCKFPARLKLIQKILDRFHEAVDCPSLHRWKKDLNAQKITIVHAAQYVRNPASVFGHLFLRFDVARDGEGKLRLDTLAHSVGFFAQMPADVGAVNYVLKGLGGGFEGHFIFTSYARSLVEYNQMEDRDLWEYELNATYDEIEQVVNHLWEMQRFGIFDYYFTLQNCAYQLLALVEGAVPRWNFTNHFNVYLIPSDGLRILQNEGAIRHVKYRASLGTTLRRNVKALTRKQRLQLRNVLEGKTTANDIADASVLNATIDLLDYQTHQSKGDVPSNFPDIKRAVLGARAQLPTSPPPPALSNVPEPPHLGHGPARISAGYLQDSFKAGWTLGLRPAMHRDIDGPGYPPGLSLEIIDLKAFIDSSKRKAHWEQITLLRVENLREFESVDRGFAWRLKIGWERYILEGENERALVFSVHPAGGLASSPNEPLQFYGLLTVPLEILDASEDGLKLSYGAIFGSVISILDKARGRIEFNTLRQVSSASQTQTKLSGELGYSFTHEWTSLANLELTSDRYKYELGIAHFF